MTQVCGSTEGQNVLEKVLTCSRREESKGREKEKKEDMRKNND